MSLDQAIVEEIAAELGIDQAFIEKDWYSVQVLRVISQHQSDEITTIFSGGTSLSKGHNLIQRFSEDLDFRCLYNGEYTGSQSRKIRRNYRESILDQITRIELLDLPHESIKRAGNYFKFPVEYPQVYGGHSALRPHLEVEFSFSQPRLEPVSKPIQSLIARFTKVEPETQILCLSPVEIAADKLSALTWRILKRDRSSENDDPAMVRHLHDLCALSSFIDSNFTLFKTTVLGSFSVDQATSARKLDGDFNQSITEAVEILATDKLYLTEYRQFVNAMSYADDDKKIDFEQAVDSLKDLVDRLQ